MLLSAAVATAPIAPAQAFASPSPASEHVSSTVLTLNYEQFKLDNGLTVLVHSNHTAPTVFVGMWYQVGAKDEPEGKHGFAHLFEHLMFQGTQNRKGEYTEALQDAGLLGLNGSTSKDRTNYYMNVPKGSLDRALWMESDRMIYSAIDQEMLDEQLAVVKNEKLQGENNPYAFISDVIDAGIYPKDHPYAHSTIGSMEDLQASSLDDVKGWFKKYYGAANAVLVLSGDITLEEAKAKAKKYFGAASPGEPLNKIETWAPTLTGHKKEIIQKDVPVATIQRAWVLPEKGTKDLPLLSFATSTMMHSKSAPLRKRLVDELQLVSQVQFQVHPQQLNSIALFNAYVKPGVDPQQVLDVLDEELETYFKQGPDAQILNNLKTTHQMDQMRALQRTDSVAVMMGEDMVATGNPAFRMLETKWIQQATPEDLRSVTEKWLSRPYYQLIVEPFVKPTEKVEDVDRTTIPEVQLSGKLNVPTPEEALLDNGIKLVVMKRDGLPIVNVALGINTGNLATTTEDAGAEQALGLLMTGTQEKDALALSSAFEELGIYPRMSFGESWSGGSYRVLKDNLQKSLNLYAEAIRKPAFPEEEIEKVKKSLNDHLHQRAAAPSSSASAYFNHAIYGDAAAKGRIIKAERVDALNRDDMVKFHKREVGPNNMTIYMVGDISMQEAKKVVNASFGDWKNKSRSQLKLNVSALPASRKVILIDQPGAPSTNIIAGHALPSGLNDQADTLYLMNQAFGGGLNARLGQNLRNDKGWTYGIHSRVSPSPTGQGVFRISTKVQADKSAEAMAEILKELQQYVGDKPVKEAEISPIVTNEVRSLPGKIKTYNDILRVMVTANEEQRPYDYVNGRGDRLQAVTVEDVRAAAKTLLHPDELTWVIVGDLKSIEAPIRKLDLGEVVVWDTDGNKVR